MKSWRNVHSAVQPRLLWCGPRVVHAPLLSTTSPFPLPTTTSQPRPAPSSPIHPPARSPAPPSCSHSAGLPIAMSSRGGDIAGHALSISSPTKPSSPPDPEAPSPMSGHDFPGDLLRAVLHRLPPADVARAACVCRLWRAVASDRAVLEAAFRAPWGVRRVLGDPATRAFWRTASLGRYALSHTVRRGDTVPGIALKYSVQVTDIKRFNNMMSDHGIYSRERLLIPISNAEILLGSTCYIEMDHNAKREVAVFYPEGHPNGNAESVANAAAAKRRSKRILESVRRSLHVDDGTAEYYLSITDGDPRAAMMEFSEDLRWEQ